MDGKVTSAGSRGVLRWASLDAIRAFAGDDVARAVVKPDAAALFTDYDRRVMDYEVIG